jgi:predicted MPP superfamily phosphohydrolase
MPSLRIAHLSDMHLAGYDDGAPFDEDADLRRELEDDLQRLVEEAGPIDLLVLGGTLPDAAASASSRRPLAGSSSSARCSGFPRSASTAFPGTTM